MPTYDIEVTRDGRWWMITVPELDGYVGADGAINLSTTTQARFKGEIDDMARDFIAVVTGIPIDDIAVTTLRQQATTEPQPGGRLGCGVSRCARRARPQH